MRRRSLGILLLLGPTAYAALTRQEILNLMMPLATALGNGDPGAFMANIPDNVPERARLAANVQGLLGAALVTSSVTVAEVGDNEGRVDWYMEIRSRATGTVVERRRQRVTIAIRDGKLTGIQPVEFFAPPQLQ